MPAMFWLAVVGSYLWTWYLSELAIFDGLLVNSPRSFKILVFYTSCSHVGVETGSVECGLMAIYIVLVVHWFPEDYR